MKQEYYPRSPRLAERWLDTTDPVNHVLREWTESGWLEVGSAEHTASLSRERTLATPLAWTSERPTKPGWYWVKDPKPIWPNREVEVFEVEVGDVLRGWRALQSGNELSFYADDFKDHLWSGPLQPPE